LAVRGLGKFCKGRVTVKRYIRDGMASEAKIIYIGGFEFPDRDSGGLRVLSMGKSLKRAGYDVFFMGVEKEPRAEDRLPDGRYCYQGFYYDSDKLPNDGLVARCKRVLFTHLTGITTFNRVRVMDLTAVRAIIAYNASPVLLWRLNGFCRKKRILFIADTTEWYDPTHVPLGSLGPFAWSSEARMRWVQPRISSLFTTSSFLERYYRNNGCAVLRLPHLIDTKEIDANLLDLPPRQDQALRLVYAGSPGKKDLITNAVRGLREICSSGERAKVELHLVGVTRTSLAAHLGDEAGILDEMENSIVYYGRVPHAIACKTVAQSDFSVLLRPDKRFAHAGFSAKLVESLSLGVPVIATLTSDIGLYIRDGREGILLDDALPQTFASGIRRILAMPRESWKTMKSEARRQAEACFDYRRHSDALKEFISSEYERVITEKA
jgi:glycosyltransferase involved in cell wall biosynthesis